MNIDNLTFGQLKEIATVFNKQNESQFKKEDMRYVIVRTYSAGVFAGNIESRNGREVVLRNARRLWQWAGSASLSQMAMKGTSKPNDCKFPKEVDQVELLESIEILNVTEIAEKSIKSVPIWES